jgi:hypothetical protein
MSKEPKDGTQEPKAGAVVPDHEQAEPGANTETVREKLKRLIADNPRFKEVKSSGKGFVFVGAKPLRNDTVENADSPEKPNSK